MARAMDTPTIVLLRAVKGSLDTNLSPVSVIIPNTMRVPPPMTGAGRVDTSALNLGTMPRASIIAQAMVMTRRLTTLFMDTMPTFWLKEETTGTPKMVPTRVAIPDAATPPVSSSLRGSRSKPPTVVPVISPTDCMILTMVIKRIGRTMDRSKDGIP